jgi:hypothetical protein
VSDDREKLLEAEKDKAIVRALLDYDDAKRAYLVAKKMSQADLARVAREGYLTVAEDNMMKASVRNAQAALARMRSILGT